MATLKIVFHYIPISLPETIENTVIAELYSETGIMVEWGVIPAASSADYVFSADLPAGVYTLRLYNEHESYGSFKLIKLK